MPTATLTPSQSTQERLPRNRILGLFDDDIENSEGNEKPRVFMPELPELKPILGSIKFNDVKEAGVELFNMTFGTGKFATAETQAQTPKHPEGKTPEPREPRKLTEPELHAWFSRINTETANVEYQNKAKDVFRITGGEPLTQGETEGYLERDAIATLIGVARKRVMVEIINEDKQEAAETASIVPRGTVSENELINSEGNSTFVGPNSSVG